MAELKLTESAMQRWGAGLQVTFGATPQTVHYHQPDVLRAANAPTELFNPAAGTPPTPANGPVVTFAVAGANGPS